MWCHQKHIYLHVAFLFLHLFVQHVDQSRVIPQTKVPSIGAEEQSLIVKEGGLIKVISLWVTTLSGYGLESGREFLFRN